MSSQAQGGYWYVTIPRVDLARYVELLNQVSALEELCSAQEDRLLKVERMIKHVSRETAELAAEQLELPLKGGYHRAPLDFS